VAPNDKDFINFVEQINAISAELPVPIIKGVPTPIVLRPDQLAIMFLLITSTKARSLIQLVTGFGKSLMFGLMSRYLNIFHGKKMAVVVPNDVLAAT